MRIKDKEYSDYSCEEYYEENRNTLFEIYYSVHIVPSRNISITIHNQDSCNLFCMEQFGTLNNEQLIELMELLDNSGVDKLGKDTQRGEMQREAGYIVMDGDQHIIEALVKGKTYRCILDNVGVYSIAYDKFEYYRTWFGLMNNVLDFLEKWGYDVSGMRNTFHKGL